MRRRDAINEKEVPILQTNPTNEREETHDKEPLSFLSYSVFLLMRSLATSAALEFLDECK